MGARVVPEKLDLDSATGADADGGLRFLVGGLRVLRYPGGGVRAADDRFPEPVIGSFVATGSQAAPSYALPPRLGGGFLFVVEPSLYRADTWLSRPRPVYTSSSPIADVVLGPDRLYVRASNGSQAAIDPRTGRVMDPGPWPSAPSVVSYRALDGWVAVAIADLRGAIATFDAGATWRSLPLTLTPKSVEVARMDSATGGAALVQPGASALGDFIVVRGTEAPLKADVCYAVHGDGATSRLAACPKPEAQVDPTATGAEASVTKTFGPRPLLAAVEDGWPLDGDTALVARDGALGRLRLSDGLWIAENPEAFPGRPARCHPLPLLLDEGAPGLGFACAEARGRIVLYAYDARAFALLLVRGFEGARAVLPFGNGAVAVRGGCDDRGDPRDLRYCVLSRRPSERAPRWTEVDLAPAPGAKDHPGGADTLAAQGDGRRLLVFDDGRIAVLYPPARNVPTGKSPASYRAAYLRFLDPPGLGAGEPVRELDFGEITPEIDRELRSGVWLDGFEERTPGVAGGWVEASGAMLGVEVSEGGQVHVGEYIRDAGSPIVSGRYGLGWGAAHRGYETTDGGMTWTTIDVPRPLSPAPGERACGPVGCTAAGWVRLGWGKSAGTPLETLEPTRSPLNRVPELDLVCEPGVPVPKTVGSDRDEFYGVPPPARRPDDAKLSVDVLDTADNALRGGPLARIYAWGPHTDDWGRLGRWSIRWLSPFYGSRDVRMTPPALAPFASADVARRALAQQGGGVVNWSMAIGDESSSALLIGRRPGPDVTILELDAERSPVEVRRADGEPFPEVYSAVRAEGQWYVATQQAYGEPPASVIFRIDGGEAREYARAPRVSVDTRSPTPPRLARRSDGRAIGLVVDGQPPSNRRIPLRWVLPFDPETRAQSEPLSLGAADLGDRGKLPPCRESDAGWTLDTAWAGRVRVEDGLGINSGPLTKLYIRARLSTEQACLEQISGSLDIVEAPRPQPTPPSSSGGGSEAAAVRVSVLRNGARSLLRCHSR
jgi:hypothetical protein